MILQSNHALSLMYILKWCGSFKKTVLHSQPYGKNISNNSKSVIIAFLKYITYTKKWERATLYFVLICIAQKVILKSYMAHEDFHS